MSKIFSADGRFENRQIIVQGKLVDRWFIAGSPPMAGFWPTLEGAEEAAIDAEIAAQKNDDGTPLNPDFVPFLPQQGGEQTDLIESVAKAIYEQWADQPGYRPWVDGGNSHMQECARRIACAGVGAAVLPQVGEAKPIRFCRPRDGSVLWLELSPNMAEFDQKYELENHEYRTLYNAPQKEQKPIRWVTAADYDWLLKNPDVGSASMTLLNKGGGKRVALLAAPATLGEAKAVAHPDDVAVDLFAAAMKRKLAWCREKGREGWQSDVYCPVGRLQQYLADHVAKGDPIGVGNFAMMIWNRGESTIQGLRERIKNPNAAPVAQALPVGVENPLMDFAQQMARQQGDPYFQMLAKTAIAAARGSKP